MRTEKRRRADIGELNTEIPTKEAVSFFIEWIVSYMNFMPIPGLSYRPGFLSAQREAHLCQFIDSFDPGGWIADFKRRRMCFGYRYDYERRLIGCRLEPLPPILRELSEDLRSDGLMTDQAEQAIVNEYLPGQGISGHVDAQCFGPEVVSISLCSSCVMRFREKKTGMRSDVHLAPRSVIALRDAARYAFTHEIPPRLSDVVNGERRLRGRRLSITFRTVYF